VPSAQSTRTQTATICDRLLVSLPILQTIPNVRNRQLIAGPQPADLDALPVDSDPVGAPQVSYDDFATFLRHTTMMPRNAQ
jgi:hypothetical protein